MNRDVAKLEEVMRLEARVGKLENEIAKLTDRIRQLESERAPDKRGLLLIDGVPEWP